VTHFPRPSSSQEIVTDRESPTYSDPDVSVGTFVLGAVAFFLLAWASQVGQRGTAMLAIQAPLGSSP